MDRTLQVWKIEDTAVQTLVELKLQKMWKTWMLQEKEWVEKAVFD